MSDRWTENGRYVNDSGQIIYEWPPKGRFMDLWQIVEPLNDHDKCDLFALLGKWNDETSTLVSYYDAESEEWVDVEPDWNILESWLD